MRIIRNVLCLALVTSALLCPFVCGTKPSATLTVEGGVSLVGPHCPGTVRLLCEGVNLSFLRWNFTGTLGTNMLIKSFHTYDLPTNKTRSTFDFVTEIELAKVKMLKDPGFANFSSIVTLSLIALQQENVTNISCGSSAAVDTVSVNVQPNVPGRPEVKSTNATYQKGRLNKVTITWRRQKSNCVEFEGSLSYTLEFTDLDPIHFSYTVARCGEEFCRRSITIPTDLTQSDQPYTLNLTAVDGAGSSEQYTLPNIGRYSSQYLSSRVLQNEHCPPKPDCGELDRNTTCTRVFKTTSSSPNGLGGDTCYVQYTVQEGESLTIDDMYQCSPFKCNSQPTTHSSNSMPTFPQSIPIIVAAMAFVGTILLGQYVNHFFMRNH